jgi:hypothetical protein
MKILHLSFHYGCISDLNTVFKLLNHEISHMFCMQTIPYHIPEHLAHHLWNTNKDTYNQYDLIITSDTVALSYIFLLHLNELKPHLIILNCNRFTYGMDYEQKFITSLHHLHKKLNKITYIPYTDFERIWCGKHNVFLHERAIMPIGRYLQHINDEALIKECFKELKTNHRTKEKNHTIFLQNYNNHKDFMDLSKFLYDRGISVDFGSYVNIAELQDYLAIVVLPDQFSKYFTFESIQNNLIVILPSPNFLMQLVRQPGYYFNIEGSKGQLTQDYINLCEWYKYPECRFYFDSFDELIHIIKNLTPELIAEKRKWCDFYGKVIIEEHLLQWKHILEKIELKIRVQN